MKVNFNTLNQLVAVARIGNFSRAAEELNISQPALSRSIANFEASFGVRVFDRGRSGASLTPGGAMAISEAQALLKQAQKFDHNLKLYGQGDVGSIALGMGPLFGSMVIPDLSIHFLSTRPKLKIQTEVKAADTLIAELLDGRIEMAFCAAEVIPDHSELDVVTVGEIDLSMIVRANHPLAQQSNLKRSDLRAYPYLSGGELESSTHSEGIFICDNYHILRDIALHTDSIWISSPQFVHSELQDGKLVTLNVKDTNQPTSVKICEVTRKGYTRSPSARAISAYVLDFFSKLVK